MKLTALTDEVEQFLQKWRNDQNYIEAYTSGSTGTPKQIYLPKIDMMESARGTCDFFGLNKYSYLWLPLSVNYIAGKMMVVRASISDCELELENPSNTPLSHAPQRMIDLMPVVPSQIHGLLKSQWVGQVKNIIVGGAPISAAAENEIRASEVQAYATFGMTETCSHVALRNITAGDEYYGALPGFTFATDDNSCLIIENQRMSWKRLLTRDVIELLSPTRFRWIGRADNAINSGGIKLHPEVLEKKLNGMIGHEFYLTGRPSVKWGEELIMVIESTEIIDTEKIMAVTREVLQPYEVPHAIVVKPSFERTKSGKIIRTC